MWYKNKILWAVVVVVVVGWAVWHYSGSAPSTDTGTNTQTEQPAVVDLNPKSGEIAVTGKLDCLPLKSGATPTSDNCIIGVKGDDGKIYALNTGSIESFDKGITQESSVKAIGAYAPADQTSDVAKIYKFDGVLTVRVLANNS